MQLKYNFRELLSYFLLNGKNQLMRKFILFISICCMAGLLTEASAEKLKPEVTLDVGLRIDFMQIVNSTSIRQVKANDSTWLNGFWMTSIKTSYQMIFFINCITKLILDTGRQ